MVNNDKKRRLEDLLDDNKDKWKVLKKINNKDDYEPPKEIKTKDGVERKPRMLANIANNHYIEKIKKIMENMPETTTTPMKMLKKLIPR